MTENKIIQDLLQSVKLSKGFYVWMTFLTISLFVCLYAYYLQLTTGLGVTGLKDYVSWGLYIANFVFFVASSLVGMLISSVLGLSGQKWITPIGRMAEIIALAFAAVAGLVIVSDMGRPERLAYVFIHGRFQSPILWDVTVVTVYVIISLLLFYIPLIPDLSIAYKNRNDLPKWQKNLYKILSLNWVGNDEQVHLLHKAIRILLILVVPVALAIHTVTSWLFAVTPRSGWSSTIFGPYFVTGAFVTGVASVIISMYIFRNIYNLKDYIKDIHFDKIGKLLVLVSLVYLYFNINEFLVPSYRMPKHEAVHLHSLFTGSHAFMFWFVQLVGLVIPIILLLFKPFRKPFPLLIIGILVFIGAWLKRYLIVIPTQEHPFLPIQYVPENFTFYVPTITEIAITLGSFVLVLMIISVLSKVFPLIPIHETLTERKQDESTITKKDTQ
ncbi:MAG: polysulfide reductase [Bacteroidetes bacterium GWA2_31_9]|nr:MAG: polysulfide reductase [Bacteroidetes bacterium GWA2_31_9]